MSTKQLSKRYRRPGFKNRSRYEEQGDRQALRGQRRAQGGPGIEKNAQGHWVSRAA